MTSRVKLVVHSMTCCIIGCCFHTMYKKGYKWGREWGEGREVGERGGKWDSNGHFVVCSSIKYRWASLGYTIYGIPFAGLYQCGMAFDC